MKNFNQIKKMLAGVEQAYIFGSYANGSEDEYSDLDILIVKKTDKDFFYRFQEVSALYELGVPLDLLIYTPEEFTEMKEAHNPLICNILKNGKKII